MGSESQPTASKTDLGSEDEGESRGSSEQAPDPYKDFRGPPEGDYEAFVLPDGAAADPKLTADFVPLAKELGLSQAGTQKLVDFKAKLDSHNLEVWGNHLVDLKSQAKADKEIGGTNYDATLKSSNLALSRFFPDKDERMAVRKMLDGYGVGAHPLMLKLLSRAGKAMGETPSLQNGGGSGVVQDKPLHEILYSKS